MLNIFGEWDLPSYSGGSERLTLEIGDNDGLVVIRLSPAGRADDLRTCVLEIEQAEQLAEALSDALFRVKARPQR